jgi:D-glycero-alpha-D-manno-heptose-7-phosphate kinase
MDEVVGIAPTRVDLAGGTLDLWPVHHLLNHKMTVNVAITLPAMVKITLSNSKNYEFVSEDQGAEFRGNFQAAVSNDKLPLFGLLLSAFWREGLPPIRIHSQAHSPAGAGLGGSSCLAVTLGASLWRARRFFDDLPEMSEEKLVQTAQDVEARLIAAPTGCQDYWAAVRGGINVIQFPYGGVKVSTIASEETCNSLNEKLIVCYSGRSRASAINNWEIYKRVFDKDQVIIDNFNEIGRLAEQCGEAITGGNIKLALQVSKKEWELRCRLWPGIETAETKEIDRAAKAAGADFTRVCGAGGGGVMGIFADAKNRDAIAKAVTRVGGTILDAGVAMQGLNVSST